MAGPFQEFYTALVARGMNPHLARLTLARKIAAMTLLIWKKGVRFDAEYLKPQAACTMRSVSEKRVNRDLSKYANGRTLIRRHARGEVVG